MMKAKFNRRICILLFGIICVMFFILANIGFYTTSAYAEEEYYSEFDRFFVENVVELAQENYFGDIVLISTKDIIYDINLEPLGYIYNFTINNEPGYAVVVNYNGMCVLTEVFFNAINPFNDLSDIQKIYVKEFNYLYYIDNQYFIVETDTHVTSEMMEILRQTCYYSSSANILESITDETIYYVGKTENGSELAKRHPGIVQISNYSNACAPIAGANLIQYWDRYKTNLIPNYTPGSSLGSFYLYFEPGDNTDVVIGQLYSDMGTNAIGSGTSIPQFKAGMSAYCNRAGYSISYNSCMQNGQFSFALAKQRIDAGEPLVLFVENATIAKLFNEDDYDIINYTVINGSHVVAGFGYKEIEYVLSDGTTLENHYIAVASGAISRARGYYNINYNTVIDDAYGIGIV